MRQRHRRTLEAIFRRPVPGGLLWADVESLLLACGAEIQERAGSRVRIKLNGKRAVFHRPHPRPVTSKGAIVAMREFLAMAGVEPSRQGE